MKLEFDIHLNPVEEKDRHLQVMLEHFIKERQHELNDIVKAGVEGLIEKIKAEAKECVEEIKNLIENKEEE